MEQKLNLLLVLVGATLLVVTSTFLSTRLDLSRSDARAPSGGAGGCYLAYVDCMGTGDNYPNVNCYQMYTNCMSAR